MIAKTKTNLCSPLVQSEVPITATDAAVDQVVKLLKELEPLCPSKVKEITQFFSQPTGAQGLTILYYLRYLYLCIL